MRVASKPKAIPLSKRANVIYLEHARVVQKDDRVLYLTQEGSDVESFFNVPYRNTSILLLGQGTSLTSSAARKLAEENVMVGFCGSGGSPLHASVDHVFMSGVSEYRPTEYMQAWMRLWMDDERRLEAAKALLLERASITERAWSSARWRDRTVMPMLEHSQKRFIERVKKAGTTTELLSAEAVLAKALYGKLADAHVIDGFVRTAGEGRKDGVRGTVNSFLDHGNYIAYGFAAVALHALGISFALPVLHGKTRRGGLVFDMADLFKDAIVMPLAFDCAARDVADNDFRGMLIEACREEGVVDMVIDTIKNLTQTTG